MDVRALCINACLTQSQISRAILTLSAAEMTEWTPIVKAYKLSIHKVSGSQSTHVMTDVLKISIWFLKYLLLLPKPLDEHSMRQ